MAQSEVNCANLALRLIGNRKVLTAISDKSTEGLACNALIDDCKKSVLRMHPWNFATKRAIITPFADFAVSNVTFISANIIEVTHATASFSTGQYVTLENIQGANCNGTFEISSTPAGTTTRLAAPEIDDSDDLGTYVASDTDVIRRTAAFDYSYLYSAPSGMLRLLEVMDETDWRVEGQQILAQSDTLRIRYIYDVTDYTTMDALFYQCLAGFLAYNLCDHLTASDGKKNELHVYLYGGQGKRGILPQAQFVDAGEDSQQTMEASDWILSRSSSA